MCSLSRATLFKVVEFVALKELKVESHHQPAFHQFWDIIPHKNICIFIIHSRNSWYNGWISTYQGINLWGQSIFFQQHSRSRDNFGYGLSRREEALLCNTSSHWQSPYPEWSLRWHLINVPHTSSGSQGVTSFLVGWLSEEEMTRNSTTSY